MYLLQSRGELSRVYRYINDRFINHLLAFYKPFFVPEQGPAKISCTDDKGRNRDILIKAKYVNV
jgi:penicillin-binding protein 1C